MMRRLALFALLYCWLLGPRFVFFDIMWMTVFAVAIASPLVSAHRVVSAWPMNMLWLFATVLGIYSVGIALANGSMNFGYGLSWFKAAVFAYSAAAVVLLYRRVYGVYSLEKLIRDVIVAAAISGLITLVIFVTPPIREITGSIIIGTVANTHFGQIGLRAYDLSLGGGTAYGVFNLLVMLMLYHCKSLFGPKTRILLFLLLAVVNFLSARGAFATTALLLLLGFAFNPTPRKWGPAVGHTLMLGLGSAILVICAASFGALPSLADSDKASDFVDNTLPWAFELFLNEDKGDGLSSGTTDHIVEEFFFPETISGFLFGVGNPDPMSDSGLVRTVFAVGLLGLFLHLAIVAGFWRVAMGRIPMAVERRMLSMCVALLLIFNFKELIFSNSRGLFGLFALIFFAVLLLHPARQSTANEN